MFYVSQQGKEPEKFKLFLLMGPYSRLVRPVETLLTAAVLFVICFDRNVNYTWLLHPL